MRQLLGELEMTSNAPTSSYNANGTHGAFASREPTTGDSWAPHLRYRRKYENASSDHQRETVIEEAQQELHRIRHSAPPMTPTESDSERDRRVVRDGEGWEADIAAQHFRLRLIDVWRIRREALRDKDYGRPVVAADSGRLPPDRRLVRVAEMRTQGMTARQIALCLGEHSMTVCRDLGRLDQAA